MSQTFTANSTISHYRVVSKIGAGGMGEVYLAQDTKLDRRVALKILPEEFAQDAERMRRFVLEAKSASALNHPNIITIHEIGETDGTHFIATEYIEGETLSRQLRGEPLSFKSTLEIAIQIASALHAAHNVGVVHRDIKPENVIIRPDGLVKILDFGIAKLSEPPAVAGGFDKEIDAEAATAIKAGTSASMIIGTASYMSPEQARGKEVDARSDIFSFGVVLYEMLARRKPFDGDNAMDVIGSILHKEPPPLRQLLPEVPSEIERIINKTLKKDRDERYQTAKDLLIDLKDAKHEFEFQNKLDRTTPPNREETKTQLMSAPTSDVPHTTSSAEFISQEVKKHKRGVALGSIILFALIGFGYWFFFNRSSGLTDAIDSIAVLPFQNRSSDADSEYLSNGLAESLIYRLSQLPKLKVSPTSSVFRYKGKETDPIKIGSELGVNAVMSGRIVQRGDNLTISVELVDVRNNRLLWVEQYERKLADLLATQREIATEIIQKLKLKISGEDQKGLNKRYTENNEAYQLYLKGRYHYAKMTKDDIRRGIEYFKQAISLDPNFALAYVAIADSFNSIPSFTYLSPKEAIPQAKAAAERALEIDPTLAEAHTALATSITEYDWDWEKAEREFKRALELNPNNSGTHFLYAVSYLLPVGHSDEAITEIKRAVELEPLELILSANLAAAYMYARQNDRALEQARKTYDLEPNFVGGRIWLATVYNANGMYDDAIALCEKSLQSDPTNQPFLTLAGYGYAKAGRRREAEEIIKRWKEIAKTRYVSHYWIATIYTALGERDEAFAQLEKAFEERDYFLPRLKIEPFLDPLRDDPRFQDLVRRMALPQ